MNPDRTALPGVQDRVSTAMINVAAVRAGRSFLLKGFLLKLDPPEFRGLVENEAVLL